MITSIKNGKAKMKHKSGSHFKERKEVKYSFTDYYVKEIFDELFASNALTLLKPKRLLKVNMIDDSKYCWYHRFVIHLINECYSSKTSLKKR